MKRVAWCLACREKLFSEALLKRFCPCPRFLPRFYDTASRETAEQRSKPSGHSAKPCFRAGLVSRNSRAWASSVDDATRTLRCRRSLRLRQYLLGPCRTHAKQDPGSNPFLGAALTAHASMFPSQDIEWRLREPSPRPWKNSPRRGARTLVRKCSGEVVASAESRLPRRLQTFPADHP